MFSQYAKLLICSFFYLCSGGGNYLTITERDNDNQFHPWTYNQIIIEIERLSKVEEYKKLIRVFNAPEKYPSISPNGQLPSCGTEPCKYYVVELGNEDTQTKETPESYYSGTLHGNERVGPNVLIETIRYLLYNYKTNKKIKHLLDTRSIWMTPTTNSKGFNDNEREERTPEGLHDANRDFPYQQNPSSCMTTIAGRTVNQLFRDHLFQIMITFHGGTEVIGYEWGSPNHIGNKTPDCPDQAGTNEVSILMQLSAGKSRPDDDDFDSWSFSRPRGYAEFGRVSDNKTPGPWYYPRGTMTDTVYFVNGGMEDWSYAGSWENKIARQKSYKPPINTCKPTSYGGYDEKLTDYTDYPNALRAIDYLVEAHDSKNPPSDEFGTKDDIIKSGLNNGLIARNMRMVLRMVEVTKPEIYWLNDHEFLTVGCFHYQMSLQKTKKPCDQVKHDEKIPEEEIHDFKSGQCSGLQIWEGVAEEEKGKSLSLADFDVSHDESSECVYLKVLFDQSWHHENHPEPNVEPQTHLVRVRTVENYDVYNFDKSKRIVGHKTWYFPVPKASPIPPLSKPTIKPAGEEKVPKEEEETEENTVEEEPKKTPQTQKPFVSTKHHTSHETLDKSYEEKQDIFAGTKTATKEKPLLRSDRVFWLWALGFVVLAVCFLYKCAERRKYQPTSTRELSYSNELEQSHELDEGRP